MKTRLIVLGAAVLIIAAALACWPRLDIPEDAAISLLYTGENLEQRSHALDAEDSAAIRRLLDGHLLLPDWTDVFTGQQFYYSSAYPCHGVLAEWEDGSVLLVLPKHGTRHLLQLLGDDALIWLDSAELNALTTVYQAHDVYYPRTFSENLLQ